MLRLSLKEDGSRPPGDGGPGGSIDRGTRRRQGALRGSGARRAGDCWPTHRGAFDAKEAAERATRAETRASEIEWRADDLNAELARVHEQNAALIAALAKPAADTDKG